MFPNFARKKSNDPGSRDPTSSQLCRQPVMAASCLSSFHHPEVKSTPSEQSSVVPSSRHSFQCHPSIPVALFRCHPTVVQKSRRRHPITPVSSRLRPNSLKSSVLFKRFPCIPRSFETASRTLPHFGPFPSAGHFPTISGGLPMISDRFLAIQDRLPTISGRFMFIS